VHPRALSFFTKLPREILQSQFWSALTRGTNQALLG
jgi:hypothetical protein